MHPRFQPKPSRRRPTVTLNEWLALGTSERESLLRKWILCKNWMEREEWRFQSILDEAAHTLTQKLAHLPQVAAVTGVLGKFPESAGLLLVTTSLSEGQTLAEVPDEFATFRVLQFGVAERKRAYLLRLEFALRAASIEQQKMDEFMDVFEQELRDIHTPFYCDTPEYWISNWLASAKAKDRLVGGPLVSLTQEVRQALGDFFRDPTSPRGGLDQAATSPLHDTFETIFSKYGLISPPASSAAER